MDGRTVVLGKVNYLRSTPSQRKISRKNKEKEKEKKSSHSETPDVQNFLATKYRAHHGRSIPSNLRKYTGKSISKIEVEKKLCIKLTIKGM